MRKTLTALFLTTGLFMSSTSEAAKICGPREAFLKSLKQEHDETQQAIGLSVDGGVIEVLVSEAGTWTILVTYPNRPTCVVAVGKAWQALEALKGDPA